MRTRIAKYFDQYMERNVLEYSDEIIVVSESMKNLVAGKTKIPIHSNIHVIPNGYDHKDFEDLKEKKQDLFIISYTGTLSGQYSYVSFLKILLELKKRGLSIIFRIIGDVDPAIKSEFEILGDRFEYIGYVSHIESIHYLLGSSMLLLIIPNVKHNQGILTGKLFEYMASKKPILCYGPKDGDANSIISHTRSGKSFEYDTMNQPLQYILDQYEIWEKNNHNLRSESVDIDNYTRKNLTKLVLNLF